MSPKAVLKAAIPERFRPAAAQLLLSCRAPLYRGDEVHCPCCLRSFRRFLPDGPERPQAVCPGCGARQRDRLVWLYLHSELQIANSPIRLLHVAPERKLGALLRSLPNVDYLSVDLSSPLAMAHMDLTDLQLPDGSFDAVVCNHVLEHILDDHQAMREIFRVLRPGAWAILQVPIKRETTFEDASVTSPRDRERVFGQSDHVRIYGLDYVDRLRYAGFDVNPVDYVGSFSTLQQDRLGLHEPESVFACEKPVYSETGATAA